MPAKPRKPEPESTRPRRLTLSQILETLLSRSSGERSTVTIARNPKGETHIEVTVRTGDDGEVVTVEDAEHKARQVYDRLHALYPPPSGHDNAEVELSRNAKGETQITVALETSEGGITRFQDAADIVREVYEQTRGRFPLASGYVGAVGDK